jgi:DNA-binding response OmpR family regulator
MKQTLLIIDDDKKLNRLLEDYLSDFGYRVVSVTHPHDGLKRLASIKPDLIVLDVMLPDMNGFEVCKTIRKTAVVPIIMLTARGELTDRILGLEIGADDYLSKPFEPRELVARIQSVLRRSGKSDPSGIRLFGRLRIDLDRQAVTLDGADILLTTNEFAALSLLTENPGKVMDRDSILQALRGIDCEAFNRSVDITMSRLRQKLGDDPKSPVYIKTVWAAGYVFIGKEDDHDDD